MDEKRLRQTLHEIAEEEIGEDMNLLPEIMTQLGKGTPRTRKSIWRTGRTLLLVALLMMSVAAVYAVYQQQTGDPGLDAAREANLVTELEMSQTIDDVTLTLNWMYADAHRMALGYSISALDGQLAYAYDSNIAITDADQSFYLTQGRGGREDIGEINAPADFIYTVGVGFMENPPQELHMRVEVTLGTSIYPYDDFVDRGDGIGIFTGTIGDRPNPEATPESGIVVPFFAELENPIGPYVFEFTLPYIPEVVLEPMETISVNGVSIELERLSITPSITIANMCFSVGGWLPESTVMINETTVASLTASRTGSGLEQFPRCYEVVYPAPYLREPTTLTLTVSRLRQGGLFTQERIDQFINTLHERGIEVEISRHSQAEGFGFNVLSAPDSPEISDIIVEAYNVAFSDFIDGPWTFTVEVPGQ